MKTTLDIPDETFRLAKAKAALRGISLRQFVNEALQEKISPRSSATVSDTSPWMQGFGALADLRDETRRLEQLIADEFGAIEPEDLA